MKQLFTVLGLSCLILLASPGFSQQKYQLILESGTFVPEENHSELRAGTQLQADAAGWSHKLVQFYQIPTSAQRKQMEATGLRFVDYLPHYCYVVAFPADFDLGNLPLANVRALQTLKPDMKIHPSLMELPLPAYAERPNGQVAVVISYYTTYSAETATHLLADRIQGQLKANEYAHTVEAVIPANIIKLIAGHPVVRYIEPIDPDPQPENYSGRTLHRSSSIATEAVYAGGRKYDGSGVHVAMGDDGIIGPHIDYQGRIDLSHVNTNTGNHGDHVAGTIMGAGNLDPTARGMAFGAMLYVYQVWDAVNLSPTSHVTEQVMITSTSYSNGCNAGYTSFARTADQTIRQNPTLFHVFSAGNDGTSDCGYGAGSGWGNVTGGVKVGKNVIAVANVNSSGTIASSSSRGPAKDGRIKPEISAKGTDVTSTIDENTYASFTGTSMACPGVSGTSAQLYHAYRSLNGNSDPESALIKGLLMNTATDWGQPGPDFIYGFGIMNALKAVKCMEDGRYMSDQLDQGDTIMHNIQVPAGTAELRIMVNWTDFEGGSGSAIALVNNIDMQVIDPNSTVYNPLVLDHTPNASNLNAPAVPGVDDLNNMEQVVIDNPMAGTYQVRVAGKAIPQGPQKYYVTYEIIDSSLTLTYPIGGEAFRPNQTEIIRWDAEGTWGGFDGEYSLDGGTTWNSMFSNSPASARQYAWSVPSAATGNVRIRVTRGGFSDMGEAPFTIIGIPSGLQVKRACPGYVVLKWNAVSGATGYEASMLGNKYMDSVGTSTVDTIKIIGISGADPNWFSVKALGPDNAVGRRAEAIYKLPGVWSCLEPNDVGVSTVVSPGEGDILSCALSSNLNVRVKLESFSPNPITNIPVSYRLDNGTVVTETYTDTLPGYGTDIYTFSSATISLAAGSHTLSAWTALGADLFQGNDTSHSNNTVVSGGFPKTLPFAQNFESFSNCSTAGDCELVTCSLIDGWYNSNNAISDDIDWRTDNGGTPTSGSGPSVDHNPGTSSGRYLYLEASTCYEKEAHLLSPCIDLSSAVNPELSFWFHLYGADMGELHVDIYANGQWVEDITPPKVANWSDIWWESKTDLTPYVGGVVTVRWRGITGESFQSDMAIDDVSIYETFVGLEEDIRERTVKVYPNPGRGLYNVSIEEISAASLDISVLDMQGRTVFSKRANTNNGAYYGQVDIGHLPAGIYTLVVEADGRPHVVKLSKL